MNPIDSEKQKKEIALRNELQKERAIPLPFRDKFSIEQWDGFTFEQKTILTDIEQLPDRLKGVVPESVWSTLNIDQKLQFLFSHELLPTVQTRATIAPEQVGYEKFREDLNREETIKDPDQLERNKLGFIESSKEFDRLKEEVREIETIGNEKTGKVEKSKAEAENFAPEDVEAIKNDSGATFSSRSMPTFAGYQPDDTFLMNIEENANGSPKESRTWTANIIKRIWLVLNP